MKCVARLAWSTIFCHRTRFPSSWLYINVIRSSITFEGRDRKREFKKLFLFISPVEPLGDAVFEFIQNIINLVIQVMLVKLQVNEMRKKKTRKFEVNYSKYEI